MKHDHAEDGFIEISRHSSTTPLILQIAAITELTNYLNFEGGEIRNHLESIAEEAAKTNR